MTTFQSDPDVGLGVKLGVERGVGRGVGVSCFVDPVASLPKGVADGLAVKVGSGVGVTSCTCSSS